MYYWSTNEAGAQVARGTWPVIHTGSDQATPRAVASPASPPETPAAILASPFPNISRKRRATGCKHCPLRPTPAPSSPAPGLHVTQPAPAAASLGSQLCLPYMARS